ncbi:MAG: hypothetical protein A3A43_03340 [Candidatus Liptonbacteria bacterium RIFCSPLOWO2_01_FULL_56_20]|uniref:Dephospho-CoA kinase n=1 Tax=Candidatus Liptonbacteria bacterium RIFCSPLOWO2_01_FULL_56_20 TaxID=1798652 RepID=A0A1G2CKS7_9BACT|nr:MAG: hypothetical protein UY96_C0004G0002 [Parcubacteria group bacterium GW2011_GWB1_56_8]OGZ01857.1 MAG: hypothetical protein A3A43_03340 [Candidatus Liptonbacteria bacterium RIFCSPLOWO2_01_FULL_56_20]
MKKSILVTGIAGSGKSTVCRELNKLGYRAHDIEDIRGLFRMLDEKTSKVFKGYNNDHLGKVRRGRWICNIKRLQKFIKSENNPLVFYCGTASNMDEVIPLFDLVVLLKSSPKVLRQRLSSRKPGNFGRTKEVQDWILSWKDRSEKTKGKMGAIVIDADGRPKEVAKNIIKIATAKN